jgi:DNA repair exonuclease SbcCD ATPase subunit
MIILKTLEWSYAFRYGANNILHLDRDILTQLLGLNGLGKSSIPLILEEVLFNKNSKPVKKTAIPNRINKDGYSISLTFEKEDDDYKIVVNRKNSIKVTLFKNNEDISSHTATNTYKTIQEILGVDFKTFSQLVYQNTKNSLQFLTATDTNRKKFLIDLLHLEEYVRLFDVFKTVAKNISTEVTKIESKVATIEKWLLNNKLTDTNILPMLKLEIQTDGDEKEARALTTEIQNISAKNKKITQNNQYRKLLQRIDLNELNSIKVTKKLSYDTLQSDLGTHEADRTAANLLLNRMSRLGDTCHVCEQPINPDFVEELVDLEKQKIISAAEAIKELKGEISDIKRDNKEFAHKKKVQRDWEDLYRSVDNDLPENLLDLMELNGRLSSIDARLRSAKSDLESTAKENQRRTKQNTRIQIIQEQTAEFQEELNIAEGALAGQRDLLAELEILKKAFSTNGLIAYKIENKVKDLEDLVNEYLAELSGGQFTLEFVLNNDKLNVEITDNGDVVDIVELSSGQLAKVNTATLLAIRKLMSSISKSKINVLFLDEVIGVLDEYGKEKLVEILLQEQELNTFVVSHGWEHPLLQKITVVDKDKISVLET